MSSRVEGKHFGKMLRAIREQRRLSVRKLARVIGISPTYLSKIERGELPPPAWDKILALGEHLKSEELQQAALYSLHGAFDKRAIIFVENLDEALSLLEREPNAFPGRNVVEQKARRMKKLFQKIVKLSAAERARTTKE
jgi:transcriptional regulator with XRE-family HTH domain